ncbi:hypothetical protein GCM10020295_57600 [Streptomyces cinereospinus]
MPPEGVPGPAAGTDRRRVRDLRRTPLTTRAELDRDAGRVQRAVSGLSGPVGEAPDRAARGVGPAFVGHAPDDRTRAGPPAAGAPYPVGGLREPVEIARDRP